MPASRTSSKKPAAKKPAAKKPAPKKPAARKPAARKPAAPAGRGRPNPRVRVASVAEAPSPADAQRAYEAMLPAAMELAEGEVEGLKVDTAVARENVEHGLRSVLAHEDEVKRLPLRISLAELTRLPELVLAVGFAAGQVNRRSPGTVAGLRKEATGLRRLLLAAANLLAESGQLPRREVDEIQRGVGATDEARDCVALAALLRKNPAAVKKTPVTDKQLDRAAELGTELLGLLRPASSKRSSHGRELAAPAVAVRDRLWTLLVKRHRELRRIGMWLFLDEADEHVPALRSVRRKKAAVKKPAPPAPPTS
jgi:hypothetical protein